MSEVEVRASEQGGFLRLSAGAPSSIHVEAGNTFFSGSIVVDTYLAGPPTPLFLELARDWRGWEGTRKWADLEEKCSILASIDRLGHVSLRVELADIDRDCGMFVTLMLDAGRLEEIAALVQAAFPMPE
jgi:hypothetical protein